jgi:hypothetical protein
VVDGSATGLAIGETIVYNMEVTLPEGSSPVVKPSFTVPSGSYVSSSVIRVGSQLSGKISVVAN